MSDPRRLDLDALRATLRSGNATSSWLARWLPATYAEPELFAQALYERGRSRAGALKSSLGRSIDLYHDGVIAHLGSGRRAFVCREGGRTVELSYDALHARAGSVAGAWRGLKLEPGKTLALALPLGPDYIVALLAALRLGLIVCPVPPHGRTFAGNRLRALAPDAVVTDGRSRYEGLDAPVLPLAKGREGIAPNSHSYAPDDPVLRVFPAFGSAELEPVDVSAGKLHGSLLRDATLVFALDDRDTLAAPGFDPHTIQPTCLLTSLIAGATWAELSASDAAERPGLLAELGVNVLGVTRALREALMTRGKWELPTVRAWFRCMTHPLDLERWDAFGRQSAAADVASFNAAFASTAGGAVLFGPVVQAPPTLEVWPAPGQPFQIGEIAGGMLEALNETGIYTPLYEEKPIAGVPRLLLARDGEGYLSSGSIDVGPDARAVPIAEVSAVVETHPQVRHASLIVTPGKLINSANMTLVAFVEEAQVATVVEARELSELVVREMGRDFAPTRVEIFPLRPRVTESGIDHGWCRSQYLSGALTEKSKTDIFLSLSRLGYLLNPRTHA